MVEGNENYFRKILRFRVLLSITLLTVLVGVVFYHQVENLSWLDSIYFTVITLATVGYGDITPHTAAGKIFTVFYVIIGVGVLVGFANAVFEGAVQRRIRKMQDRRKQAKKDEVSLK